MFKVFARDWWCRSQKVNFMDIHADLAVCLPICSAINSIPCRSLGLTLIVFEWKVLKSEARNSKSETISNKKNSNDQNNRNICANTVFVIRKFDIWICFEFRYSDIEFCRSHLRTLCPLGLNQTRTLPAGRDLRLARIFSYDTAYCSSFLRSVFKPIPSAFAVFALFPFNCR